MQKLDFSIHIKSIATYLRSDEIVKSFDASLQSNVNPYNGVPLTTILLESKSSYDTLIKENTYKEILDILYASNIYETKHFSTIINEIHSRKSTFEIFYKSIFSNLYNFHSALIKMTNAVDKIFFDKSAVKIADEFESGYIILEILSDDTNLTLDNYLKIFELLIEIINALNKANNPSEQNISSKLVLLDSGSGTNLGIQTTIETAKSLFYIFKEVWDWIVNKKYYQNRLQNQSILDNLEVIKRIDEYKKSGALTEDESKALIHTIKTRAFDLVELNVLPKQITQEKFNSTHRDLLLNYKEMKRLNPPSSSK
ncbi:MAG: hypothetical protein WCT99_07945 [Bacteroidota bacterium]|jgi:hypothetical protein